jgi:hypothetical protein
VTTSEIADLVEYVPLAVRVSMWFVYDGAPSHCRHVARDVLNITDDNTSISREGPSAWTPYSPDLNPQDFCACGLFKALVYSALVLNVNKLHMTIVNCCQTIRNYPGIFERIRQSLIRRAQACVKYHGGHFELF